MKNVSKYVAILAYATFAAAASSSCEKESSQLQKVEEITVMPERLSLKVGEISQLTAITAPAGAVVAWSSSFPFCRNSQRWQSICRRPPRRSRGHGAGGR